VKLVTKEWPKLVSTLPVQADEAVDKFRHDNFATSS
jgi:hypothetical protein